MKRLRTVATAALALTVTLGFAGTAGADETKTIAENASADPQFSTLVAALTAADLVGPFDACNDPKTTVFAPTNEAFEAAFAALGVTAEQVLADTELLTTLLTYHVVEGEVPAATVVTLDSATTLQGEDVKITVDGDKVMLNDTVNVVATDVKSCNGIIHVIDAVLIPPTVAASLAQATTTDMPDTGTDPGAPPRRRRPTSFRRGALPRPGTGDAAARRDQGRWWRARPGPTLNSWTKARPAGVRPARHRR